MLTVIAMFLIRVGIPIILLVSLGMLIDRWQTKREKAYAQAQLVIVEKENAEEQEELKLAS